MYVLTPRFNSLPIGDKCVKLVGEIPVLLEGPCKGRYLIIERRGVYASDKPLAEASVFYVAAGYPRRVEAAGGVLIATDGLDLFNGFTKRGLWRELEPSLHTAVAYYAGRCAYCTAYIEAVFKIPPQPYKSPGMAVEVEKSGKTYKVVAVAAPGHSDGFKTAILRLIRQISSIERISLGITVDAPLDLYSYSQRTSIRNDTPPVYLIPRLKDREFLLL
ncbi:hypothetical protein [Pyrobaculum aerophilum]|uniref:hypothetical protein n=1 Tax=Pyrobaculum aerophilum TaxID=13773 RepID=UPI0023F12ABF|nr:hypothetical protein [Pyrobaculum aerophilum]MCX8137721.1 hypothetical protein [Pyrobaculum aerophilum]